MHFGLITLFPELFSLLKTGMTGRAIGNNLIKIQCWNPRDFTTDPYHSVDDSPYGGGPGMVMKVQPLQEAIRAAKKTFSFPVPVIAVSPQGKVFNQATAVEWSKKPALILVAGRYEGIDERLLQTEIDEEWSIGDYVLSGGELPIMVMIDSVARLLPGVLGDEHSAQQDSFMNGLLDYPHYTRPEKINGLSVPKILTSGNHAAIAQWRLKQSLGYTWLKRPDLLAKRVLNEKEQTLLKEFIDEYMIHTLNNKK